MTCSDRFQSNWLVVERCQRIGLRPSRLTFTALELSLVVRKVEGFGMQAWTMSKPGADDGPLDAWLGLALRQAFGGTLFEPLPADLLAVAAGQPQSRNLQMAGGSERRLSRPGKMREGQ